MKELPKNLKRWQRLTRCNKRAYKQLKQLGNKPEEILNCLEHKIGRKHAVPAMPFKK